MLPNYFSIEITIIPYVLYIPKVHNHVAVVRNISNVVVNKLANPYKIRENVSFFLC